MEAACGARMGGHGSRACLKISDVSSSEGFWAAGKQFFRRNPGGFQGKIAPSRGQKPRRLGMLTFFKQALAFTNELGGHLMPHTVCHNFKRVVTAMGLPTVRFHDASVIIGLSRQALVPQGVALI